MFFKLKLKPGPEVLRAALGAGSLDAQDGGGAAWRMCTICTYRSVIGRYDQFSSRALTRLDAQ